MKTLIAILLVILVAVGIVGFLTLYMGSEEAPPAPAPTETNLETYSDDTVTFQYPAELPTAYIHVQEWPPRVTVSGEPYACQTQETEMGESHEETIDGRTYCVRALSEGAAGSTYITYDYTTVKGNTLTLTFTTRQVQCLNYDDPQQTECLQEREAFNIDTIVDGIVDTLVLN